MKSYSEAPKVMLVVDEFFGKLLAHDGGALINGTSALNKKILQISLASSFLVRTQWEAAGMSQEEGPCPARLLP